MQSLDCAQMENEEEEEESWQERDQMAEEWEEEQHLEEIVERRMEVSSLHLDAMQNVLELVANQRMSQGKRVKSQRGEESTRMVY